MTVYFPVQYTAQDPTHGLELWCHAMMGLQFAHVPPLPAEAGCESCERIVLLFVFNCVTINLQRFTSRYGSRHFVACDC